jgi:type II secretory ATPase GspE/PulE/Tfp pilus assembly ATPase PilB-like protein
VATFPTEYGEKVVLRVLSRSAGSINLDLLGLGMATTTRLKAMVQRAHGMVLVTGPTGSGKTTTLYAMLNEIDARSRNVMTLEDPIEYRFADVIQGQTHNRIGFTFAKGLRSILRQDPDVVMVGEMRDAETSAIAFKAALTGHLVLSSLHTNSAIETFLRLFDMGIERYVVASALSGMMGQRLIRKLCTECCRPVQADSASRILMGAEPGSSLMVHVAVGCKSCLETGYRGRVGVFELVEVDDELAELVKDEDTTRNTLQEFMMRHGQLGLRSSGFDLVRRGITSVAEVVRVT